MPGRISNGEDASRKLFIGGLTYDTTDDSLKEFYSQWGKVVDCIVMRDPLTQKSRGFGFVTYSEADMLDVAMNNRPHTIDGRVVEAKHAIPKEQARRPENRMSVKKVFVGGIKDDHTEAMLTEHFGKFGAIEEVDIITDKITGRKRGFAFLSYPDFESVDRVVAERAHMIGGHRCDVKKAISKEEMRRDEPQVGRDRMERGFRSRGMPSSGGGPGGGSGWTSSMDQRGGSGWPQGGQQDQGRGGQWDSSRGSNTAGPPSWNEQQWGAVRREAPDATYQTGYGTIYNQSQQSQHQQPQQGYGGGGSGQVGGYGAQGGAGGYGGGQQQGHGYGGQQTPQAQAGYRQQQPQGGGYDQKPTPGYGGPSQGQGQGWGINQSNEWSGYGQQQQQQQPGGGWGSQAGQQQQRPPQQQQQPSWGQQQQQTPQGGGGWQGSNYGTSYGGGQGPYQQQQAQPQGQASGGYGTPANQGWGQQGSASQGYGR